MFVSLLIILGQMLWGAALIIDFLIRALARLLSQFMR